MLLACRVEHGLCACASQLEQYTVTGTYRVHLETSSLPPPSTADISAAKAAGKVWVNLNSGVYHKGGRWYGKTKNGKFMTEDEAKKAGYTPAHRD